MSEESDRSPPENEEGLEPEGSDDLPVDPEMIEDEE